jgi:hypothetical protein
LADRQGAETNVAAAARRWSGRPRQCPTDDEGKSVGAAMKVLKIATGQIREDIDPKSAEAELGKLGGQACKMR